MRLFVRILGLFDAVMQAMFENELLGTLLCLAAFAICIGIFLKIRHAVA